LGFWDDLDANPNIAASFDALMGPAGHGLPDPQVLANPADWESVRTVVDVGGGTGALLAEILRNRPDVRGTLVDLPQTVARSGEIFRAAGVADSSDDGGPELFRSATQRGRRLHTEERPERLARSPSDGHSETLQ
jgi:hypothetical protein